jgi:hypothetical protein
MSTISLRLPDSLHDTVRRLAERDHVSLNQFITLALTEKVSALLTEDYLKDRAARADLAAFEAVLAKVPDAEPDPADRL